MTNETGLSKTHVSRNDDQSIEKEPGNEEVSLVKEESHSAMTSPRRE